MEVTCQFETNCIAFQFEIQLADGMTLVVNDKNEPICSKGFDGTDHAIKGNTISEGKYRFVCTSNNEDLMPTNCVLMKVIVDGKSKTTIGEHFNGLITNIEFTLPSKEKLDPTPADVSFVITVGDPLPLVILDENSEETPVAKENVDVTVRRTIKANEWSTLCLPFDMTGAQVKTVFGDDVQIADFSSWSFEKEGNDIARIRIGFTDLDVNDGIRKNHPYIIKVTSPVDKFNVSNVTIEPEEYPESEVDYKVTTGSGRNQKTTTYYGHMYGYYVKSPIESVGELFLSDNQFWYNVGYTTIKAFRATFYFNDGDNNLIAIPLEESSARIQMVFDENEATGISGVAHETSDNRFYNLNGQRVENPKKGLYIKKNKKVVVK